MIVNSVAIEDSFAEAFGMKATRLVITADTLAWAHTTAAAMTGFATSVIACGCEAGIERALAPAETPDGRPGVAVLVFAMSLKDLQKQVSDRVGQCVMTAAGSACFSGLDGGDSLRLGGALRYFGDGFQIAKKFGGRRYWRLPVMDGEFICEDTVGTASGVGGGNFLVLAESRAAALAGTEAAVAAMREAAIRARDLHARAELMRHMAMAAAKAKDRPRAEAVRQVVAEWLAAWKLDRKTWQHVAEMDSFAAAVHDYARAPSDAHDRALRDAAAALEHGFSAAGAALADQMAWRSRCAHGWWDAVRPEDAGRAPFWERGCPPDCL